MIRPRAILGSLILGTLTMATPAFAQDEPDTPVESTVIVDGETVTDGTVPAAQSGLTVDPFVESDAEHIRKDAKLNLVRGYLPGAILRAKPSVTVVSVDQVTVVRPNSSDGGQWPFGKHS